MPKLTMMVGASGSGKSTEARKLLATNPNTIRVNRDELRLMSLHKWRGSLEEFIFKSEIGMVKEAAKQGYHVIVDDTNLTEKTQSFWQNIAKQAGMTFEKKIMSTSLAECVARDAQRKDHTYIGRAAIERQFLRGKLVIWDPDKQVVIFDIDGTLADLKHRIPWITTGSICPECQGQGRVYEVNIGQSGQIVNTVKCSFCENGVLVKKHHDKFYMECHNDTPIDFVVRWAQECRKHFTILIVSGRSPEHGTAKKTIAWLDKHGIEFDHIYMRRPFNHGPDTIEKQLILNDLLASGLPKEQIAFVVDDRPTVVQMWKDNGIRVIPVRGRDDDKFYEAIQKDLDSHPPVFPDKDPNITGTFDPK